jgi:putative phosphoribosyl transferase
VLKSFKLQIVDLKFGDKFAICNLKSEIKREIKMRFKNRTEAGRSLAKKLDNYANRKDVTVLALPRGGVPVGYEVAQAINAPLDVFVVRKLGVPGFEELAMGAIASGGFRVVNEEVVRSRNISNEIIDRVAEKERRELKRREYLYRKGFPPLDIYDRIVILVDDGIATGSTMRAAILGLKQQQPAKIIVAVPITSAETCANFIANVDVDEVVSALTPARFYAVGWWYENFSQVTDKEVQNLLRMAKDPQPEMAYKPVETGLNLT